MPKRGIYNPSNTIKYKGKKILKYKSSWEKIFMEYCDKNNSISQWNYESIAIPYTINKKRKNYYPDFWIILKDKEIIIEIKPKHQTKPPKRNTPSYSREVMRFLINQIKWDAAKKYCKNKNMIFKVITENTIKKL